MLDHNIWVKWDKPRRFSVRLHVPRNKNIGVSGGYHVTLGIVAETIFDAINKAQEEYPTGCVQSINDTGPVDFVVVKIKDSNDSNE